MTEPTTAPASGLAAPHAVGALPNWAPVWASRMVESLASGTATVFLLHGNTNDFVALGGTPSRYGQLNAFLAEQMFGRYELVMHYDLARGLMPFAGTNAKRLQGMVPVAAQERVGRDEVGAEPAQVFAAMDALFRRLILRPAETRPSVALIIDQASFLFPAGEPGRLSYQASGMLVTLLNWAQSPHLKSMDVAIVLIDERRGDISDRIVGHPHVVSVEVPMPDIAERERYLWALVPDGANGALPAPDRLATLTAGLSLGNLRALSLPSLRGGAPLDDARLTAIKKELLEKQCQGLVEFIEPKWGLDTVVGLDAAKGRLREDSKLLATGGLDCLPMGYLICGPVGTGKSFLMQCAAGEFGVPCLMLRNFRSKYVGETEGNLERVLTVLRSMGPVLVVIDEADAMLGDRDQENDPTGSRTFAMVATQMGDTRYRGRIIWALLTARPDLLPVDLKRQGRAEVHIPLFYPNDESELKSMAVAMARKLGAKLAPEDVPAMKQVGSLSGSDVEGMIGRALRMSRLGGADRITKEALAEVVADFLPSTQGLERRLQELAAVLECTDRAFLPKWALDRVAKQEGRAELQAEFTELRLRLEGR
ncbi:MAG TPA: AAA family ATPase [Gemmatimonadaceae bacterium]|nr:AAA family ATPase [Gemmatimonadaceae bacterium]